MDEGVAEPPRRWFSPILAVPTPVIFVVAAALASVLLWRQGGLSEILISIRSVHPLGIVGILLVYAGSILLLGIRWHALVRMAGGAPHWSASAEVFLTSVIVNYAAPIGLAVPTRAGLTVRDLELTPGQSGAVVGWEAALDLLALSLISAAWLLLGGSDLVQSVSADGRVLLVSAVIVVLGVIVVTAVSRSTPIRSRIAPFTRRLVSSPARHPVLALIALALTAAFWAIQIGIMAALLQLFGVAVSLSLLFGIMGVPVLVGMLSPVPGGAGVRELLMAAAARLAGIPAGPVVLAAVAYRLALFLVTPLVWVAVRLARAGANHR
ncbi:MAG TPA: lysylphosphatidylglycerol synthase transmembrane domain-containing protein [Thermomicrobiales bacterium]|nr:lysylphosphatidylglycerol synthase transmembrane domain-containing protein [Thermomicrobiales bacterium]